MTPKWGGGGSHTTSPLNLRPSIPDQYIPPLRRRRAKSIATQGNGSPGLLGNIPNTEQYRWPGEALSQENDTQGMREYVDRTCKTRCYPRQRVHRSIHTLSEELRPEGRHR